MIVSTVSIFAILLVVSSLLLGLKQKSMALDFARRISDGTVEFPDSDPGQYLLVLDTSFMQEFSEYRIYAVAVISASALVGGALISLMIMRLLRPLRRMAEDVSGVDMDNADSVSKGIGSYGNSKEMRELANSFRMAFQRIYKDYEKQRQFSANIAHELRTPLAVLLAKVDVFRRQNLSDSNALAFADVLGRNIERLSKLVDDSLFLSSDHKPVRRGVSVRDLCDEIVLNLADRAESKRISLHVVGDDIDMVTDDILLERAVYNLVDNAIKYADSDGRCTITIERASDEIALIKVTDDGPGIPDSQKDAVFDLFYRIDRSRSQQTVGYGIGLSLVRDIVQKLGGDVKVSDNKPRGCVFTITLPVGRAGTA